MNKVVVITGGSSGIGKGLADLFLKDGDKVFVLALDAENTETSFKIDVSDDEAVRNAIETIGQKEGKIDVVVNCAGFGIAGALELTPLSGAKKQFDVNFFGTFNVNKYAIKFMTENSVIVNIASACALFPLPYRGLYSASKSAVNLYSESLAMELAPSKIKVISINPGDTKTNFCKNRVKVFETNERYGDRIARSLERVDGNQERRMTTEYVAKKIYKISLKKNPKTMYIIGKKYKFLYFASRVLPKRLMLHFTKKMFNK